MRCSTAAQILDRQSGQDHGWLKSTPTRHSHSRSKAVYPTKLRRRRHKPCHDVRRRSVGSRSITGEGIGGRCGCFHEPTRRLAGETSSALPRSGVTLGRQHRLGIRTLIALRLQTVRRSPEVSQNVGAARPECVAASVPRCRAIGTCSARRVRSVHERGRNRMVIPRAGTAVAPSSRRLARPTAPDHERVDAPPEGSAHERRSRWRSLAVPSMR